MSWRAGHEGGTGQQGGGRQGTRGGTGKQVTHACCSSPQLAARHLIQHPTKTPW